MRFDSGCLRRLSEHALTIATGACVLKAEAEHEESIVSSVLCYLRVLDLNPDADLFSVQITGRVVTIKVAS